MSSETPRDLKFMEEVARQSELKLRDLADQLETERARLVATQALAKVGSWETDLFTYEVVWSAETYCIFELAPEQFQPRHQNFLEFVHPADRTVVEAAFDQALDQCSPCAIEHRLLMPDGRIKFVEERWQILRDEQGNPVRAIGTCQDITASKEAQNELDRFFTLSLDILCVANPEGYFIRLNPAIETVLGFSRIELMGQPFIKFVHPDDVAATLSEVENLASGVRTGGFENRYRCRDGTYKWLSWTAAPFNGSLYSAAHDITALREAEVALQKANDELELHVTERTAELRRTNQQLEAEMVERQRTEVALYKHHEFLEAVLENTAEGIVACDADGQLTFFNRATRGFHGLPLETLPAARWSEYYSLYMPDGITPMRKEDVPLFRALLGEHVSDMEMVIAPQEGRARFIIANGEPLFDAAGKKLGAVVVMHDITARKHKEVELQRAKQDADAANLAKSEFLSRMSHELRTPLNAILGFGQILEKEELPPLQRESVGYVLKGGRHLLNLINEVLDIARVEAGRFELSLEPVALDDVVPEACILVHPLAAERGIRLDYDLAMCSHSYVLADRQRLKQVLINLLSNAIKYNRPGGQVMVSCRLTASDCIRIAVQDTGPGIPAEDLPRLFTPFERLSAVNSGVEGTGLGLALSQRLVAVLGGTLEVESIVGQGSVFTIELPQTAAPEALLTVVPEEVEAVSSDAVREKYSVLCIEDNVSNLRLLEIILARRPEVRLLTAMQGSIGLDFARQHEPDLILLDLHLPDMYGHEVLMRLQRSGLTRDIPVIIISADATSPQVQQVLDAGAMAYLTKPLDVAKFLRILDEVLQGSAATRIKVRAGEISP